MKRFLLTSLFAAATAIGFNPTAHAQQGCESADTAQMRTEMAAEQSGGNAIRLSSDQAERFLGYINDAVGPHTEYWGDGVIIGRFPAFGYDAIAIVDDGCVDESKLIRLNPEDIAAGLERVQQGSY